MMTMVIRSRNVWSALSRQTGAGEATVFPITNMQHSAAATGWQQAAVQAASRFRQLLEITICFDFFTLFCSCQQWQGV
jgi:hypothetical protein